MTVEGQRPGWRDVLEISKELRDGLDKHREDSAREHREIARRLTLLENAEIRRSGQQAGERRILGLGRQTLTILLAAAGGGGVGSVLALFRPHP